MRSKTFSLSLIAFALAACTSGEKRLAVTGERANKMQEESASGAKWFGFTPYPRARELCDQMVDGRSRSGPIGIHWRSYAAPDATEDVIAFYAKAEGVSTEGEQMSITVRRGHGKAESVLSVYAASAAGYPTCDSKPRPEEKTVIIVSRWSG